MRIYFNPILFDTFVEYELSPFNSKRRGTFLSDLEDRCYTDHERYLISKILLEARIPFILRAKDSHYIYRFGIDSYETKWGLPLKDVELVGEEITNLNYLKLMSTI